jgi:membrane-associated phospholipid phosphatase
MLQEGTRVRRSLFGNPYFLSPRSLSSSVLYVFLALVISILVSGCATLENGKGWGQDAIYPVDLSRISRAAYNAFFDVQTLIPVAGALLFTIDDYDRKVSRWATKNRPLYGSEDTANNASDIFRTSLKVEAILTALATPSGEDTKNWLYWKAKGLIVERASLMATEEVTGVLKTATSRTRPDQSNKESFPSYDTSQAFSYSTLANRNLESINMPSGVRVPLQIGNILMATGVAWQRVETKMHFPSDVLAGAALGHFLTAFIHDAFIGLPEETRFGFVIFPMKSGVVTKLGFAF